MILYQAIPEIPNLTSHDEVAQTILLYLATVIVGRFPLMVDGCEAIEEEGCQFVRERRSAMAQHTVTGIVDRYLKIIEEF
jgi:hypothetical protein